MDKISLIPTFKVLHWTISLRTFVLIANRKLIFSLPWGRNTLAYKESRWLSPEAGWRGLFYRESDRCLSSPLLPPQWSFTTQDSHGDPYKTPGSHLLGRLSIHDSKYSRLHYHLFLPQRPSQTMCSSFQQYLWVVGAGETACLYLN